jgi:hypothetical protein
LLKKKWLPAFLFFGLTPVTRPEAVILIPFAFLVYFFLAREKFSRPSLLYIGILLIPSVCWSLFCKFTTNHFLPNTFYLKSHGFSLDFDLWGFTQRALFLNGLVPGILFVFGIIFFITLIFQRRDYVSRVIVLFLFLLPLLYYLAVTGSRKVSLDGYYWTRWLDPATILLMLPFCIGFASLLTGRVAFFKLEKRLKARGRRVAALILVSVSLGSLILGIPRYISSYQDRSMHLASDSRAIHLINVKAGKWIAQHTPVNCRVGVNDSGAIRYFGKRFTVDLVGLNNAEIAFGRGGIEEMFKQLQWLAIFPPWFERIKDLIIRDYTAVKAFSIPLKEYTVCNCPDQTRKVIFRRNTGGKTEY